MGKKTPAKPPSGIMTTPFLIQKKWTRGKEKRPRKMEGDKNEKPACLGADSYMQLVSAEYFFRPNP
jgi:hypothetical protein